MKIAGNHLYEHVTRMHPNDLADLFGCTSKAAELFLLQIEDLVSIKDHYRILDELEEAEDRIRFLEKRAGLV